MEQPKNDVLRVKRLHVEFQTSHGMVHAVKDVSLEVKRGRIHALVGESGSGKSVTSLTIMNLLAERNTPLTAEEIGEAIAPSYPKLALSTVYRNLELFTNAGLLEKSFFQDGVTRYSLAKGHHGHYLICTGCQEKIRLEDCPLHELEHKLTDETGFTITDHDLTLYGLCPACKGKTKNGK